MFVPNHIGNAEFEVLDTSNHESRQLAIMVVNGIFIALVAIIMSMRMFTKVFLTRHMFLDDILMIISAITFVVFCSINLAATTFGFGQHVWDLPGDDNEQTSAIIMVQQLNYISLIILSPAIVLAKLSIIALFLRIFPQKHLRAILYMLAIITIACCTSQAFVVAFQCGPVSLSWDFQTVGNCYNISVAVVILGAVNVVTDFLLCIIPIPYFLRLNMPLRQRICLCSLFLTGLIACAISIVRVDSLENLDNNLDITYVAAPYFNWSVAEVGLAIITGSVPSVRPFMASFLPNFFKSHHFPSFKHDFKAKSSSQTDCTDLLSSKGTITITTEYAVIDEPKSSAKVQILIPNGVDRR